MRALTLLLAFIFSISAVAQTPPPVSLKGQASTSKLLPKWNLQVPNQQATNMGGIDALIETGDTNLLANQSFEASVFNSGWTITGGSNIVETSTVIDGKKSLLYIASANAVSIKQSSTSNAAAFALGGAQGLGMVYVNTLMTNLYLCPVLAGVSVSANFDSLCAKAQGTGKWELLKIPFVFGATSNGIELLTSGVATGNLYVDKGFAGIVDLKADVSGASLLGTLTISNCSANYSTTSATLASFGTATSCTYVATGSVLAPSTQVAGFRLSNLPSGTLKVVATSSFGKVSTTTNADVRFAIRDVTNSLTSNVSGAFGATGSGVSLAFPAIEGIIPYTAGNVASSYEIYGTTNNASAAASIFNFSGFTSGTNPIVFEVYYFPFSSVSTYSATNADTDWASCGHTTGDFTGFGTVSAIETQCKRQGSDLLMKGKFTTGTVTAVEARLNLKLNGVSLTSAGATIIPSLQVAGNGAIQVFAITYFGLETLIEPSVGYVTFGVQNSTTSALQKALGTNTSAGTNLSFSARIPIAGWTNSNVIIGTFNEIPTTRGSNGVDIQSVFFGSGANCATACSTGSCTICKQVGNRITSVSFNATGTYDINGIDGTKYFCTGTADSAASGFLSIISDLALSTSSIARIQSGVSTTNINARRATVTCIGIP